MEQIRRTINSIVSPKVPWPQNPGDFSFRKSRRPKIDVFDEGKWAGIKTPVGWVNGYIEYRGLYYPGKKSEIIVKHDKDAHWPNQYNRMSQGFLVTAQMCCGRGSKKTVQASKGQRFDC